VVKAKLMLTAIYCLLYLLTLTLNQMTRSKAGLILLLQKIVMIKRLTDFWPYWR